MFKEDSIMEENKRLLMFLSYRVSIAKADLLGAERNGKGNKGIKVGYYETSLCFTS